MSTWNQTAWHFEVIRWYYSIIPYIVLRQVHSPFQSEFSKVGYGASSFNFQYPVFFLRSSSRFLHLLRLPFTYILHSITCFTRQFLSKMILIQIAFHLFCVCRVFLSSITERNTYSLFTDRSNRSVPSYTSTTFQTFQLFLIYFHKCTSVPVYQFHHHTKSDSKRNMFT
jgi:hypothetical protein